MGWGLNRPSADTRSVPEPSGALAVAGMKRYIAKHNLQNSGKSFVATVSGANMNFNRLRFVAERAELGEGREALMTVIIPERPGAFLELQKKIVPRAVTEFSYRYSHSDKAFIYCSFALSGNAKRQDELSAIIRSINEMLAKYNDPKAAQPTYYATDISSNELAKTHARYIIGGRKDVQNERLFRFEFPERPGALLKFLEGMQSGWNLSMFHYRFIGGDVGKVLTGFQIPDEQAEQFDRYLKDLDYRHVEETHNEVARNFLYDTV